jgi:hypothetical protein
MPMEKRCARRRLVVSSGAKHNLLLPLPASATIAAILATAPMAQELAAH